MLLQLENGCGRRLRQELTTWSQSSASALTRRPSPCIRCVSCCPGLHAAHGTSPFSLHDEHLSPVTCHVTAPAYYYYSLRTTKYLLLTTYYLLLTTDYILTLARHSSRSFVTSSSSTGKPGALRPHLPAISPPTWRVRVRARVRMRVRARVRLPPLHTSRQLPGDGRYTPYYPPDYGSTCLLLHPGTMRPRSRACLRAASARSNPCRPLPLGSGATHRPDRR